MAEEEESAQKEAPLCEECKNNPSKYKCPGCSIRTCSLPCVKSHKHRTSCTGKKQYTEIVPISLFDDNLLLSDYNMLEEVKRIADSGRRIRIKNPHHHYSLPFRLKQLRTVASNRRINLLFLSVGMSKHEKNQTSYDPRKKTISWSIEWRFHSTNVVLTDHCVNENTSLWSVIENHLKPGPWKHQLKQFCDELLDSLQFFIRTNPKGLRSPLRKLDINAPIREQLANLIIVEYPIILVYLPSHSHDFEIINNIATPRVTPRTMPPAIKENEIVKTDYINQPGVIFKEEEILEVDGSSNPRVTDLIEPSRSRNTEEIEGSFVKIEEDVDTNTSCKLEFSGINVDFQQEWDDIYCDLMGDSKIAEELLQINGISMDGQDLFGEIDGVDFNIIDDDDDDDNDEELEEGEIA